MSSTALSLDKIVDFLDEIEWALGVLENPARRLWNSPEYAEERAMDENAHAYNEAECEAIHERLIGVIGFLRAAAAKDMGTDEG